MNSNTHHRPSGIPAWNKTTLSMRAFGKSLELRVPHDVFSTQRIDEGTQLLLDHLPEHEPEAVLDMGCGYGALGLPIAARFPRAQVTLVDRDLLAVFWARLNAEEHALSNTVLSGSLGFRDLPPEPKRYDWILCNVPARIGRPFVRHLLERGRATLTECGEIRLVVISDLAPMILELREELGWPVREAGRGPRHTVFALAAGSSSERKEPAATSHSLSRSLYSRDQVEIGGLKFDRPFDLGGDDPRRLASGLPVLLDVLPRQAPRSVFSFRSGYGPVPLISRARWPSAEVIATDRDLLATEFIRMNAAALHLDGNALEIREAAHFPDAIGVDPQERFDLILGELSPSAGEAVALEELRAVRQALAPGGSALLLALEKLEQSWIRPYADAHRIPIHAGIRRDGYTVLRLTHS